MPTLGGKGGKCCLRITKTPIAPIGQSKGLTDTMPLIKTWQTLQIDKCHSMSISQDETPYELQRLLYLL